MAKTSEVTVLRKLTPATVCELPRSGKFPAPPKAVGAVALYVIYGVAEQAVTKPSQFDAEQKVIYGTFEVVRPEIAFGEGATAFKREAAKFKGEALYLPEPYHSRVSAALEPNKETGEIAAVEFALKVSMQAGESPTGYVYTVENLINERSQDKMAAIRANVEKIIPKTLPAPAK